MLNYLKKIFYKKEASQISTEDRVEELFNNTFSIDTVRFEIGNDITEFGADISKEISSFRECIAENTGFIFPLVHVINNSSFQENQITIFIQGKEIKEEFLIPNKEKVIKDIHIFLEEIYKNYLDEIFTSEFLEKIILKVQEKNAWLIWNVTCFFTTTQLINIFVRILEKNKSIKTAEYIFQKMDDIFMKKYSDCCVRLSTKDLADEIIKQI